MALHAITLGFVFSMVFGHAAIILPAVTKFAVPYHPTFYVPWVLLQASLVARPGGDAPADWTRAPAPGSTPPRWRRFCSARWSSARVARAPV